MAGESFRDALANWIGIEVTVVNPESFKSTALGKGLTFQSYKATLKTVGDDFVMLTFASVKGANETNVEQIIPTGMIKRISVWGEEKLIHL